MAYELRFLLALLLTISIELAAGLLLKKLSPALFEQKLKKFIPTIILATMVTLPYIWLVFPLFLQERTTFIAISELWAWLGETMVYKLIFDITWKKALAFAFILNLVSFTIGLFVNI